MNTSRYLIISSLAFALAFASCKSSSTSPAAVGYHIVPVGTTYGKTWSQWSNAWWQWAFSMPNGANAVQGNAPANTNQSGSVWFLAGCFHSVDTTRYITVPSGTALFFPILNSEQDTTGGYPPPDSLLFDQRQSWNAGAATRIESADIDGNAVQNIPQYFADTLLFTLNIPTNNFAGDNACSALATSVGDYLMVDQLSIGQHSIHFHGAIDTAFVMDITYKVTVQ
jgi:hypothetical protein